MKSNQPTDLINKYIEMRFKYLGSGVPSNEYYQNKYISEVIKVSEEVGSVAAGKRMLKAMLRTSAIEEVRLSRFRIILTDWARVYLDKTERGFDRGGYFQSKSELKNNKAEDIIKSFISTALDNEELASLSNDTSLFPTFKAIAQVLSLTPETKNSFFNIFLNKNTLADPNLHKNLLAFYQFIKEVGESQDISLAIQERQDFIEYSLVKRISMNDAKRTTIEYFSCLLNCINDSILLSTQKTELTQKLIKNFNEHSGFCKKYDDFEACRGLFEKTHLPEEERKQAYAYFVQKAINDHAAYCESNYDFFSAIQTINKSKLLSYDQKETLLLDLAAKHANQGMNNFFKDKESFSKFLEEINHWTIEKKFSSNKQLYIVALCKWGIENDYCEQNSENLIEKLQLNLDQKASLKASLSNFKVNNPISSQEKSNEDSQELNIESIVEVKQSASGNVNKLISWGLFKAPEEKRDSKQEEKNNYSI